MARKAAKFLYVAVWLALLAFVELSYDSTETSDSEAIRSILFAVVWLLALPISLIAVALLMAIAAFAQSFFGPSIQDEINGSVLVAKEWFRLQFFLWWLLMFAASYWQWFRLFPRIMAAVRRWIGRNRATPPEAPPA